MSDPESSPRTTRPAADDLAIVLTGGGARAAYQVGVLRCIARQMPDLRIPIITGVSAGAVNAAYLAAYQGDLQDAIESLTEVWAGLEPDGVFRVDTPSLGRNLVRWGGRLVAGGVFTTEVRGLVDSSPLRSTLKRTLKTVDGEITGIARNLDHGLLRAIALTTLNYSTGQTVTWVQGCDISTWERPNRRSAKTRLTVDHVMASAALPLFFPAVRLGNSWYGDGGIRLAAPLSPALHLGAGRIVAVSTRYQRSLEEASRPAIAGYPPPAQILGQLLNAIFLDVLDQDVLRTELYSRLVAKLPAAQRQGMRPVEVVVLRPSQDLGRLASEYEPRLPATFRYLTRGLGTRETKSSDFLSMLMFQQDYLRRLIEIGESDAEARRDELRALVDGGVPAAVQQKR